MANYKPLACHYARFGEKNAASFECNTGHRMQKNRKKNSKPLTKFPGSKFSFRLNLDEKL